MNSLIFRKEDLNQAIGHILGLLTWFGLYYLDFNKLIKEMSKRLILTEAMLFAICPKDKSDINFKKFIEVIYGMNTELFTKIDE